MYSAEQYAQVATQAQTAKRSADSDENAEVFGKAWSYLFTAGRHAKLVSRFEAMAASERNMAARYAAMPTRQRQSERARVRAAELYQIAQNHREAAEQRQEQGEKTLQDAGLDLRPKKKAPPLGEAPQEGRPDAQINQEVPRDESGVMVADRPTGEDPLRGQVEQQPDTGVEPGDNPPTA